MNNMITHPKYRQIALVIYGGVLLVGLFDWLLSSRPPKGIFGLEATTGLILFGTIMVLLIYLEMIRPIRVLASEHYAVFHLVAITLLASVAISVSKHYYGELLLLIAVLFSQLTFSRWVKLSTILFTSAVLFSQMAFGPRGDFISIDDIQRLMIYALLMSLIFQMSRLIKQESDQSLELKSLYADLQKAHTQLQVSGDQATALAVANERNHMAREIHDGVGHHLAAINIQLEIAMKLLERDPSTSLESIGLAKSSAKEALNDVRQSVGTFSKPEEPFKLNEAISLLVGRFKSKNLAISTTTDGDEAHCPQRVRLVLYRMVQEGLTNAHKHASASRVKIWLQFTAEKAQLRIIDDGCGFDMNEVPKGIGLSSMRERVESLDGFIDFDSRQGEGTVIDVLFIHAGIVK